MVFGNMYSEEELRGGDFMSIPPDMLDEYEAAVAEELGIDKDSAYSYISRTNNGWRWEVIIKGRGDMIVETTFKSVCYKDLSVATQHYATELMRISNNKSTLISSRFWYQG